MDSIQKSYPDYKPSGVEWLGDVPAHWDQLPGRACYYEKKLPNTGMRETTVLSLSYGQIVVKPVEQHHGLVPASFETYQVVEPGDIIIRPTDLQNDWTSLRFGLSRHHGTITSAYMCFRTRGVISHEYGHLLLHTYDLKKIFYGLGSGLRQNLNWRDFEYLPCLVPPLAEQTAIIRYLDHADERIRRYISAKERLIVLLEEQRQIVIHRAVTRGINPNVRLKPSAVQWLGDVPAHWEVMRLRYLVKRKLTYGANVAAEYANPDWPRYLRITDFDQDGVLKSNTFRSLPPEIARDYLVQPGDILLARSGATVGKAFLVPEDAGEACYAGYLIRACPQNAQIDPHFLFAFTQSTGFTRWKNSTYILSTIQNISAEKYANLHIPCPPLSEQTQIIRYLNKETANINAAIDRSRREIELLKEYRTRLTADVVTGKLDVRKSTVYLPNEVEMDDHTNIGQSQFDH